MVEETKNRSAAERGLTNVLANYDANEDGSITTNDAVRGVRFFIEHYDANKDGVISTDELVAAAEAIVQEQVDRVLAKYDTNNDGSITTDEALAVHQWFSGRAGEFWKVTLLCAGPGEDDWDCSPEDFEIQPEGPIVDVFHIHLHPGLKIHRISAVDGPEAHQPRPHSQALTLPPFILFHFLRNGRPRSH